MFFKLWNIFTSLSLWLDYLDDSYPDYPDNGLGPYQLRQHQSQLYSGKIRFSSLCQVLSLFPGIDIDQSPFFGEGKKRIRERGREEAIAESMCGNTSRKRTCQQKRQESSDSVMFLRYHHALVLLMRLCVPLLISSDLPIQSDSLFVLNNFVTHRSPHTFALVALLLSGRFVMIIIVLSLLI